MEGPTLAALQEVLADLEDLPASEERDKAIAKVRKQIEDLQNAQNEAQNLRGDAAKAPTTKAAEADAYWLEGDGALKIAWSAPGAYDRALTHLGKYVTDDRELRERCARLYYQALGRRPQTGATAGTTD